MDPSSFYCTPVKEPKKPKQSKGFLQETKKYQTLTEQNGKIAVKGKYVAFSLRNLDKKVVHNFYS